MTLRELRKRKGLSQTEAAERAQLDQTAISQIELGKIHDPHVSTVRNLAAAYGVRFQDVINALADTLKRTAA